MKLSPCKCGGKAKYICEWGLDDQYVCDSCDYKTKSYYDGAEYAANEWQKRNNPNPPKPELSPLERYVIGKWVNKHGN